MANAGRVSIVPKGEYSDTVDYKRLDLVRFDNDLYIAKKANTGVAPTDSETWMLALENVSQTQYDDLINGTTPVGKAKDADTVDGLHASDFAKSEQFSTQGDFTWMQSKSGNLAYRLQVHSGEVQYWESTDGGANWAKKATLNKNYLPLAGGTLSGNLTAPAFYTKRVINGATYSTDINTSVSYTVNSEYAATVGKTIDGVVDAVLAFNRHGMTLTDAVNKITHTLLHTGNMKNHVLPLDGSVPMRGHLKFSDRSMLEALKNHFNIVQYQKDESDNQDENNLRWLSLYNAKEVPDAKKALKLTDVVNDRSTVYHVLHTGNSQKVVTSASAPSDTSALWVDTTNKKVKAYIDGAWTAMA